MKDVERRLEELQNNLKNLKKSLNLEEKEREFSRLKAATADPNLWKNPLKASEITKKMGILKEELGGFKKLHEDLHMAIELFHETKTENLSSQDFEKELLQIEHELKKLELKTFLSGKYDFKNALVSIHSGQGGTEAMDWASMLYRMYLRFCERRGFKTATLSTTPGEEAGIKSVTFKVIGSYAYGYLKKEGGTHRLVRQSPFNADNLRQTSFALVEILPEFEERDLPDIRLKDEDLEWQFFRSSSQGGQNVQKVSTAVRVKHIPTNITVTAQNERFQEQNRKIALNLLRAKLWALQEQETKQTKKEIKGEYRPPSWGTQIRSYVLHPYKMVKDLRTQVETSDTDDVLDGGLEEFIEAQLKI